MFDILVLSHEDMAEGIYSAVNLILGKKVSLSYCGYHEGQDFEKYTESVYTICKNFKKKSILIFCDLFGASPYNSVARNFMKLNDEGIEIRCITGVNLAMVLEACSLQNHADLTDCYQQIMNIGRESILEFRDEMGFSS